jgi:lycopene elongase/hydratase (dihydrobisanhydrobacterioruberin-forming)
LVRISRPRFWLYLGGTYLVGYAAGAPNTSAFTAPIFWLLLAYFLLPANLFLYGVNDLADEDTDRANPKKGTREHLLQASERDVLAVTAVSCAALGAALGWVAGRPAGGLMLAFLALGAAYSLPPPRLKARPVLDSASNVLYAVPGFLGFALAGGAWPPPAALLGAAAWTAAMHLFSAVPDIQADRSAGLATTATVLGPRGALAACTALWALAVGAAAVLLPRPWLAVPGLGYPLLPALLVVRPGLVERVYWAFPALNALAGFGLFAVAAARLAGLWGAP